VLPYVSIVIVNYNGLSFLKKCLPSILEINYPREKYEIIMVDNASTDNSVDYVRRKFPYVKIIKLARNYGFTGGCNIGAKCSSGDFIFFLNNDTVVDKNCLIEAVKVMLRNDKIAICGSKVISLRDFTIQYGGGFLHYMGDVIYVPISEEKIKRDYLLVGSICGASFLIRRRVFWEIGGFDDSYFAYSDEVDLCHRAWLAGYYVMYCPKSIVYHYGGGTAGQLITGKNTLLYSRLLSPLKIFYGNRNSLINIMKNFELKNMFLGLFISFFLFIFQLLLILKKLEVKKDKCIKLLISAYIWPLRHLKIVFKKRAFIQTRRKRSDRELVMKRVCLPLSLLVRLVFRYVQKQG